jgi:hypothetical protein
MPITQEKKDKVIKLLSSIEKKLKPPVSLAYADKQSKREYLGSFDLRGDEIPKELDAEYGEEYEMTIRVRVSEVGDDWMEPGENEKKKRVNLQIKKITDIKEVS